MSAYHDAIEFLPDLPGVYSVWADNSLIYIGQSESVTRRMHTHTHWRKFIEMNANKVLFFESRGALERLRVESFLIYHAKPILCKDFLPKLQPRKKNGARSVNPKAYLGPTELPDKYAPLDAWVRWDSL